MELGFASITIVYLYNLNLGRLHFIFIEFNCFSSVPVWNYWPWQLTFSGLNEVTTEGARFVTCLSFPPILPDMTRLFNLRFESFSWNRMVFAYTTKNADTDLFDE